MEDAAAMQALDMNIDWVDFGVEQDACVSEQMTGFPDEIAG